MHGGMGRVLGFRGWERDARPATGAAEQAGLSSCHRAVRSIAGHAMAAHVPGVRPKHGLLLRAVPA